MDSAPCIGTEDAQTDSSAAPPAIGVAFRSARNTTLRCAADAIERPAGARVFAPLRIAAAEQHLFVRLAHLTGLARHIANSQGSVDVDACRSWVAAHTQLREAITTLAAEVSALPAGAPARETARARFARFGEHLALLELPVVARLDVALRETWAHFNSTLPDSEGVALAARLKAYALSREDLHRYVVTGRTAAGLERALADARRNGEWTALGVVRAACQLRADYLRTTTAGDAEALRLDGIAKYLSERRAVFNLSWNAATATRLNARYPDASKRPKRVQQLVDDAMRAIATLRQEALDRVALRPECHGICSTTRALAADALCIEANIAEHTARTMMDRSAKARAAAMHQGNDTAALIAPPPALHPFLAEGGLVDQKRTEALAIDPRLCDVIEGGERALELARAQCATQHLRLSLVEHEIAHLLSKKQAVPSHLLAELSLQRESFANATQALHDDLARLAPRSLSPAQRRALADLGNELARFAAKTGAARYEEAPAFARAPTSAAHLRLDLRASNLLPALLEAIARNAKRSMAEALMIHELGIEPASTRAFLDSVSRHGDARTVREYASKRVDADFAALGADARAVLADTLTLDIVRKRVAIEVPERATPVQCVQRVELYCARLASVLVEEGVRAERALELARAERSAIHEDALAGAEGLCAVVRGKAPAPDAQTPVGASAATRDLLDKLALRAGSGTAQAAPNPLRGVPLSPPKSTALAQDLS